MENITLTLFTANCSVFKTVAVSLVADVLMKQPKQEMTKLEKRHSFVIVIRPLWSIITDIICQFDLICRTCARTWTYVQYIESNKMVCHDISQYRRARKFFPTRILGIVRRVTQLHAGTNARLGSVLTTELIKCVLMILWITKDRALRQITARDQPAQPAKQLYLLTACVKKNWPYGFSRFFSKAAAVATAHRDICFFATTVIFDIIKHILKQKIAVHQNVCVPDPYSMVYLIYITKYAEVGIYVQIIEQTSDLECGCCSCATLNFVKKIWLHPIRQ